MSQFNNVRVVAHLPGRLRVEVPQLYRSPAAKEALERRVAAHPGIIDAQANPLTARVLILFEPGIEPGPLLSALGLVLRPAGGASGPGRGSRPARGPAQQGSVTQAPLYAPWHNLDADEALAFFDSSPEHGLSSDEAEIRLRQGANIIPRAAPPSTLQILLDQFASLPIILLGVSAAVSLATGGLAEAAAIGAVLVLNAGIGFKTERDAEATLASLSELVDDVVTVVRGGRIRRIEAPHVVPGDIILLAPGTRVAADARLLESRDLLLDESALTGESFPVAKDSARLAGKPPLAERCNMAYRGTAVAAGSGSALVVGTGRRTEVGAIAAMGAGARRPKTPVQAQLDQLGGQLIMASAAMCVAIFGIGLLRGYGRIAMFKTAMSLAIAAVPEGLPTVATTALARGMRRMRASNVLIRHLQAVETVGAIQTICLDKTGTLTRNVMSAVAICTATRELDPAALDPALRAALPELERLLQVCVLCSEAQAEHATADAQPQFSATEGALVELAARAGVGLALRDTFALQSTQLRADGRNFMLTLHRSPTPGRLLAAVKGSPDQVLALCERYQHGETAAMLDEAMRRHILEQNAGMASRQLRVLGFAWAEADAEAAATMPLTWLGLVGLADPLRPGVADVIGRFHRAGIATIMLTGDQAATASEIGRQLHLNNGDDLKIVNSEQLDGIPDAQLGALASGAHVFARVTPAHKLRIVQALQQAGQIVAMTGDGINDSPALRAADIGIAMGSGTEVALSAADIALKEDELAALLDAVGQGRTIAANIRKSIHFLLSSNLSEILLVAGGVAAGLGQPLTPLQLLWLNLLSDVLPAIALGDEVAESDVMQQAPRGPGTPIVGKDELWRYVREGAILAGGALAAYSYGAARYGAGARAGTLAFDTLVLGQMLHALSCRSDRHRTLFNPALAPNRKLVLAIVASLGLQVAAHMVPGLRRLLGISALSAVDLGVIVAGALAPVLVNESAKPGPQRQAASSAMAERSASLPTTAPAMPLAT